MPSFKTWRELQEEAERKAKEREAWLQTPQGKAWQKERKKEIKKKEKEDKRRGEEDKRRREEAKEKAARNLWTRFHKPVTMDDIAGMTGTEFEVFLARLFAKMGYREITLRTTNDQGGDLVCLDPSGVRVVIQAKRRKRKVGVSAVQEVYSAKARYNCTEGRVVTNSTFAGSAKELAYHTGIVRCDGKWLEERIKEFFLPEIPEFNWEVYNKVVKDWDNKAAKHLRLRVTGRPRPPRSRR